MHSRRNYDAFACLDRLWIALERCNYQHVTVIASNGLTESLSPHPVLALRVALQLVKIALQVCVGVRIAVGKVNNVRIVLESHRPSQSVVIACVLAPHRVLIVTNVSSAPHPAFASSLGLGLRVDQRAHAMIVETVGLHQVDDIEAILLACPRVRDAEVVPLGVASRVIVRLQDQVVFILVHLDGSAQISRFKTRFEEKSIVLCTRWNVKWRYVACFCCIVGHGASVGRRVDSIVDDSIKEVLLVHYPFCFTPEALFKNELLWRIERLKVPGILDMIWWVPHENTRGTTAKKHQSRMLDISYQSQHEAQTDALTF